MTDTPTPDPIHTCLRCGNEMCCAEAAAEVERLTAEREELIDLLQAIYEALSDDR